MKVFRQHIIFRFFCLLMAFHIFNCSVDAPDMLPNYIPEDLSYNDMESVVEIVLEKIFDIENAVSEHDENDTEEGNSLSLKKDFSFHYRNTLEKIKFFYNELHIVALANYDEQYSSQFHPEIVPPPPKA